MPSVTLRIACALMMAALTSATAGFMSYFQADGLVGSAVQSIFGSRDELFVVSRGRFMDAIFDHAFRMLLPRAARHSARSNARIRTK